MKKTLKKRVLSMLLLLSFLIFPSCSTDRSPSNKPYDNLEKDIKKAEQTVLAADQKSFAKKNAQHKYSYFVTYKKENTQIKQGIENTLTFSNRGTQDERIHRKNTLTELTGELSTASTSENYYYLGGFIHANCYGTNFKAPSTPQQFLDYSNGSDIATNPQYLGVINFNTVQTYYCTDGTIEILCTSAKPNLKNAIYSFIGFDRETEKKYNYSASDVTLTVFIDKNGAVTKKELTFIIDYYWQLAPDQKGKYEGSFTYTLTENDSINVEIPPVTTIYTNISDINLLTAVTDGYSVLATYKSIDADYNHKITLSDTITSHLYDVQVHFTEKLVGDKLYYGSIDTKKVINSQVNINTTTGMFINDTGYHERSYDIKNEALSKPKDIEKSEMTPDEMMNMVIDTLSAEALHKSDITGFSIASDGEHEIVFKMSLNGSSARYYAAYLMSVVAGSESDSIKDLTNQSLRVNLNEIYVTVRKSDCCIVKQTVKYEALLNSAILINSSYSVTVNSTSDDFELLTESDWNESLNEILAKNNQEQE